MRRIFAFTSVVIATAAITAQSQQSTVALVGARVIDGTGAAPIANATILVSNGRITRVGPAASVTVPADAARVDVAGKTIMPGLINAHGHLNSGDRALPLYDQIIQQLKVYRRYGVTTVYALGDDGVESVRVRDENTKGPLDRARLFASGPSTVGTTPEQARTLMGERHVSARIFRQDAAQRRRERHAPRRLWSAD